MLKEGVEVGGAKKLTSYITNMIRVNFPLK